MNLIKEYLGSVAGVHVFDLVAMLIFLVTFLFVVYHVYTLRKEDVREYGRLPLEEDDPDQSQT